MNAESGFTLMELLVSVAITFILASLGVANYREFKARAYDAENMTFVRNLETSVVAVISEEFFLKIGTDTVNYGHGNGASGWGSSCTTSFGHANPLIEFHPYMCETQHSWMVTFNYMHAPLLGGGGFVSEGYDIRASRRPEYTTRSYVIAASFSLGRYQYRFDVLSGNVSYAWTS